MKKLLLLFIIFVGAYYGYLVLSERSLPEGTKIDRLVVHKSERRLEAYSRGELVKSYTISLGKTPVGDKQHEGDNKTPEGRYTINGKNPHSAYYKNLGVSYPNAADRREAKRLGKPVGGDIKIHGLPNKMPFIGKWHRLMDWTAGCMAVTNDEMEELYQTVPVGTPIDIKP
ncbi:L,D-transpeptidase family protein [Pontibacter sp. HSC-14F20]|uniref:L,D-transpeptidase family protein n=1 Tax=Pontibacter sp. HSC-14F20 TaxID=2864136 RepID=UPI001C7396EA|nr:L,D-transpeptidase family protein [Pontibacter sp. HSC-14F20]MBX0333005.1 L,D-transpeptidase family protein [Pontibacter sp. HSC-14F20]